MHEISSQVSHLAEAAWAVRHSAATDRQNDLPFALALFTDDRRQSDILALLAKLPPADNMRPVAVIFRHDGLGAARLAVATEALNICRGLGHHLFYARGRLPGASGSHNADVSAKEWSSRSVHNPDEAALVERQRTSLAFISPVFATASHPDDAPLGVERASALAKQTGVVSFALGGINLDNAHKLQGTEFQGIGVLGAWSEAGKA